jgi:hypothetical protein
MLARGISQVMQRSSLEAHAAHIARRQIPIESELERSARRQRCQPAACGSGAPELPDLASALGLPGLSDVSNPVSRQAASP